ncbi:amidase family protein, partial [Desertihabitans aurantiacus]|uniref:amidase family protein n=1 Tax=Desertihabitans aurantiacus TaxID=2282477 RepID=UPI0022B7F4E1
ADAARPPRRLRVGVLTAPLISADVPVHPAALRAVERAAGALQSAGHQVTGLEPAFPPEAWQGFAAVWAVGALGAPVPPEGEDRLRPLTRWLRERGRSVSGLDHARALQAMQQLTQQVDTAWQHVDVVLTPTMAAPPWPVGALRDDADPAADFDGQTAQTPWCSVWNITGAPSLQLPLHAEEVDGVRLPFGVLLGGRPGADAELLAVGAELEALLGFPPLPPGSTGR